MSTTQSAGPPIQKPLRLWPGVIAVVLQWAPLVFVSIFFPDAVMTVLLAAIGFGLVILVWWLFFSRASWPERVGVIVLMTAAVYATKFVVHPSIANAGMSLLLPFCSIPLLSLVLVVWAVTTRGLSNGPRRAAMVAGILLACGLFTLVRTGGISGEGSPDLHWRWTPSPEERLLAQAAEQPPAPIPVPVPAQAPETQPPVHATDEPIASTTAAAAVKTPEKPVPDTSADQPKAPVTSAAAAKPLGDWPGFRGPDRDGVVRGTRIETDWSKVPPVELWRWKIGPGWSSFAVHGDLFYTQEQRGEDELVSCYNLSTGKPVWSHRDATRFWESNGGPGPRGTPSLSNGRVYTLGGTGIVNALDAGSGAVLWSHNAATDTGAKMPEWGFAGSPLAVADLVIVAASGRLAGYDAATGTLRWSAQTGGGSYSSPHLATIGNVVQVLLENGSGVTSIAPADGKQLWKHAWEGVTILQPARTPDGDLLITAGDMSGGMGTRRISVTPGSGGWTVAERWASDGLKPYYNDFVVHNGHVFGFDGSILACISLEDGKRKWKGGRYGHGQLVLLADQDLLLVLAEEGELALVKAVSDQFTEVARFKAIEGKTWNHPVLVGDVVLVRNGEEMAAFRLSPAAR